MSKAFASIKRGLQQAIRHRKGERIAGPRVKCVVAREAKPAGSDPYPKKRLPGPRS